MIAEGIAAAQSARSEGEQGDHVIIMLLVVGTAVYLRHTVFTVLVCKV